MTLGRVKRAYLGAGLGNCAQVVDHVGLGHANTGVAQAERLVLLVRDNTDVKILARVKDRRVGQRRVTDFVEGIGAVGDQFSEEDFLVRVERVCNPNVNTTSINAHVKSTY